MLIPLSIGITCITIYFGKTIISTNTWRIIIGQTGLFSTDLIIFKVDNWFPKLHWIDSELVILSGYYPANIPLNSTKHLNLFAGALAEVDK